MENQGKITYHTYLKIENLLQLQNEVSSPRHQDELLFITIHQSHELYFKLMLHEIPRLNRSLNDGAIFDACKVIMRLREIIKALIQQMDILHTLAPDEFLGFRDLLAPASGFQSYQYKSIEFALGLKTPSYIARYRDSPDIFNQLDRFLKQKGVWDHVLQLLKVRQFPIPQELLSRDYAESYSPNPEVTQTIRDIYLNKDRFSDIHFLFESLIELDTSLQIWRLRHMKNAEKTIGFKTGTGGSSGVDYLQTNTTKKCFPELWEARNIL